MTTYIIIAWLTAFEQNLWDKLGSLFSFSPFPYSFVPLFFSPSYPCPLIPPSFISFPSVPLTFISLSLYSSPLHILFLLFLSPFYPCPPAPPSFISLSSCSSLFHILLLSPSYHRFPVLPSSLCPPTPPFPLNQPKDIHESFAIPFKNPQNFDNKARDGNL